MVAAHRMLRVALLGLVIVAVSAPAAFSQETNQEEAYRRYELAKVDPWGPFVLNLLLPFGIGSWVQGDEVGGLVVAGGQLVGIVMVAVDLGRQPEVDEDGATIPNTFTALSYVGLGVSFAATVVGYVIPFTFANAINEQLKRDLGLSKTEFSLNEQGLNITMAVDLD